MNKDIYLKINREIVSLVICIILGLVFVYLFSYSTSPLYPDYVYFVIYGGLTLKGTYLKTDIFPCYKYHIIQDWHAKLSERVKNEMCLEFESCKAKWILTDSKYDMFMYVINEKYELVDY